MWARQCTPVRVPTPRWNQPAGLSVPASTSISGTSSCPAPASPPGLKVGPQPLGPLPLPTQRLSEGELLDLRGFQTSLHAIYLSQQGLGHLPEFPHLLRKLLGGLRGCVGRDLPRRRFAWKRVGGGFLAARQCHGRLLVFSFQALLESSDGMCGNSPGSEEA